MRCAVFLCFLICFLSCKKEVSSPQKGPDCSHEAVQAIDPEISKFKFKPGTYWVYIDSVSLVLDTVIVDAITYQGLTAYEFCPENYFERYVFTTISKHGLSPEAKYNLNHNRIQLNNEAQIVNSSSIYRTDLPKKDSVFVYDRYYKSVVLRSEVLSWQTTNEVIDITNGILKQEIYENSQLKSRRLLKDKFLVR